MTVTTDTAKPITILGATDSITPQELLERIVRANPVLPFDQDRIGFLADFARRLSKRAKGDGSAQALAFWLRRAELLRLQEEFTAEERTEIRRMPRGTIFHVPPANVDSIFMYSMALSMLTGNRNIVRMSSRVLAHSNLILDTVLDTLTDHASVAETTALISYRHDDAITATLSAGSDVRVIWGGDTTVAAIRRWPLPPHGREVTFPDRFSMAAINTERYLLLDGPERDDLIGKFYNDTFWFDQMGCSSPRTLIWVGERGHQDAAGDFHSRLARIAEAKGYSPDAALAVAKMAEAFRGIIDRPVDRYEYFGNADTVLESPDFLAARGEFCGGGLLYQTRVDRLPKISPHVRRTDQTLTVFGIDGEEIDELVTDLAGRGIDRIVPVGKALDFSRLWDGYDLLSEFTRLVSIH